MKMDPAQAACITANVDTLMFRTKNEEFHFVNYLISEIHDLSVNVHCKYLSTSVRVRGVKQ